MNDKTKVLAVVAVLAIAGVALMLAATRLGIGVYPDSTVYFDAARNLADGRGLAVNSGARIELVPLTHYPPLYSALLALTTSGGVNIETAARWLNGILFGVNIFLVGLSISFCVRNSFWLPVIGAFLMLTAPDVLAIHSLALTEPLYLALTFGGLLCLAGYLRKPWPGFLLSGSLLIALSCLTRYVGIVGVITGICALILLERNEGEGARFGFSFSAELFRRRVFDGVIFLAVCCAPIVFWSVRNRMATGGASARQLAFHPIKLQQIVVALSTAAQWLLLGKVRPDIRLLAFIIEVVLAISLIIYLLRKGRSANDGRAETQSRLLHLLVIFGIGYVASLIFSITFIETDIVLDSRSLVPVHVAALILVLCLARSLYRRAPESGSIRILFLSLVLLLVGSYAFRAGHWLARVGSDGQGYTSRAWKESPTVTQIRKLPSGNLIYSNGVDAIHYLTGRRALDIPAKLFRGSGRLNPNYEAELQQMSEDLRHHHGVLVYFNTLPERWTLPLESELKSQLTLNEVVTAADGSVYELTLKSQNRPGH